MVGIGMQQALANLQPMDRPDFDGSPVSSASNYAFRTQSSSFLHPLNLFIGFSPYLCVYLVKSRVQLPLHPHLPYLIVLPLCNVIHCAKPPEMCELCGPHH